MTDVKIEEDEEKIVKKIGKEEEIKVEKEEETKVEKE